MRRALDAIVLAALAMVPASAIGGQGPDVPIVITSDTAEYCNELAGFVAERLLGAKSPPHVVIELANEGRRMCDVGMVRGGIFRLRRAMVLLEHPGAFP